jgi:predicted SAM-dependent methyltransferase
VETLIDGASYLGLNVGSGPHYADGWCNTDILPAPSGKRDPDVIADIFNYREVFKPGTFTKAYIGHVLEHIPMENTVPAVQHIASTVAPGGAVMAVGPCIERAVALGQPQHILDAIRHHPDKPQHPWSHAWTPTEALTLQIMQQSGLERVEVVPVGTVQRPEWPNPSIAGWQTAVIGYVPSNTGNE